MIRMIEEMTGAFTWLSHDGMRTLTFTQLSLVSSVCSTPAEYKIQPEFY